MILASNRWLVGVVSTSLLTGAALWEGTRYQAYYDLAGVPTVCQGYTGKGIIFGKTYSPEECRAFLHKELVVHSNGVLGCITQPLKQNEHDAFTLFAYNVGVSGFCNSRAAKTFNSGNVVEACKALYRSPSGKPVWSYAQVDGVPTFVQGLYNRRRYEAAMCLGEPNARLD